MVIDSRAVDLRLGMEVLLYHLQIAPALILPHFAHRVALNASLLPHSPIKRVVQLKHAGRSVPLIAIVFVFWPILGSLLAHLTPRILILLRGVVSLVDHAQIDAEKSSISLLHPIFMPLKPLAALNFLLIVLCWQPLLLFFDCLIFLPLNGLLHFVLRACVC